jgi:hypothetical protein
MRLSRLTAATFLVLLAMPLAGIAQQSTSDTTKLPAAMRTARAGLNSALSGLKGTAAMAFFADSAVAEFQGQVYSGKPAVEAWLSQALAGVSALKFTAPTFTISANEIIETAPYTVATPEGEQPGTSTSIWRRSAGGKWLVTRLTVQ